MTKVLPGGPVISRLPPEIIFYPYKTVHYTKIMILLKLSLDVHSSLNQKRWRWSSYLL